MAEENLDIESVESGEQEQKRKPKIGFFLLLIALGVLILFGLMSNDGDQPRPSAPAEEDDDTTESNLSTIGPSADTGVTALTKRQEELEQKIQKLSEEQRAFEERLREDNRRFQNQLSQELSKTTQLLEKVINERVDQRRFGDDLPATPGGSVGPSPGESGQAQSNFPYRQARGAPVVGAAPLSPTNASFDEVSPVAGGQNSGAVSIPGFTKDPATRGSGSGFGEASLDVQQNSNPRQPGTVQSNVPVLTIGNETAKTETYTIPAFSFTRARLLHGVSCPVTNQLSGSFVVNAPVIIPIEGEFHGPNGDTRNIGTAHLFGFCFGVESDSRPHAVIKIERISYVGLDGDPQEIPVNGYIIDGLDNREGVTGVIESRKGGEIAAASTAAALEGAGRILVQSQFTTNTSGDTGNVTKSLTGSAVGKAVGASAFSEVANQIAEHYREKAESMVDVIHLQGAHPIQFITTAEFSVEKTMSAAFEEVGSAEPLL